MTTNAAALEFGPFFSGLQRYVELSRTVRAPLEAATAPRFNIFDYLQPGEVLLSRIIADLLRPDGSHGQGTTFLDCFWKQLSNTVPKLALLPVERLKTAIVDCEVQTAFLPRSRRIDIRVDLPPDPRTSFAGFGLGIENKPWAIEQTAQLSEYQDELDRRYRGRFLLLFLCPSTRLPVSISPKEWERGVSEGRCAQWDFRGKLAEWVLECRRRCEADKMRHFLADFSGYLRSAFE